MSTYGLRAIRMAEKGSNWITSQLIQAFHHYGTGSRLALYITRKGAPRVTRWVPGTNCLPFRSIWFNSRFSWIFLVVFCLQLFVFSPFSFWLLYCLSVENGFRLPFGISKLFLRKRIFKRWPLLIPYFCIWNCWKNEINISKLLSL